MSLLPLCIRCRISLIFSQTGQLSLLRLQKRFRHAQAYRSKSREPEFTKLGKVFNSSEVLFRPRPAIVNHTHTVGPDSTEKVPDFFVRNVRAWATHPRVYSRLRDFGIPPHHIRPLLRLFSDAVQRGELHKTDEQWDLYGLTRFSQGLRELSTEQAENEVDVIYSTIFFTWASDPKQQENLADKLPRDGSSSSLALSPGRPPLLPCKTLSHVRRLSEAASRQYPAEEFPAARRIHRRIIMHVGPTNSGKTHHALRALSAAPTGVYAGPLRLLAHEVWERLNLGEIGPANGDTRMPRVIPDYFHEHPSLLRALRISKRGDIAIGRPCNMITGEEQKIVSESAPLLSCTVEMLSTTNFYDVAVVDEIQMISDPQRGAAWTTAVLGLCAREIHLCGEATAIPVVQALLRETGDEIEVRSYERLTPLVVEEQSLDGNYGNVQKGDCVVAFSRSGIFGIKKRIEDKTGMRCAVVYGKLPPEVRSEQARLFNDPDSGYDVIIGSDAIGMGLNLKIRRIIFDALSKWSGSYEKRLSTSQVKQIAGRAGRYGMTEPSARSTDTSGKSSGGTTTTLYQHDLPYLHQALAEPIRPLPYARLGVRSDTFARLVHVLPQGASTFTIYEAHIYVGRLGASYRYSVPDESILKGICQLVDEDGGEVVPRKQTNRSKGSGGLGDVLNQLGLAENSSVAGSLTIDDRILLCLAPVQWRDPRCLLVMKRLIRMYRESLQVDLHAAIKGTGFMEALEGIESNMGGATRKDRNQSKTRRHGFHNSEEVGKINQATLSILESFHKVLAMYIWMSFRNPASWGNREAMGSIKLRVEHALELCLEGLSKAAIDGDKEGLRTRESKMRHHEFGKHLDRETLN